jgi:hypothetical protein
MKLGLVEGTLESGLVKYASANGEYGSVKYINLAFGIDGSSDGTDGFGKLLLKSEGFISP